MNAPKRTVLLAVAVLLLPAGLALAWHGRGHHVATTLALEAADKLPEFLSDGAATVAHCSLDPDLFTRPIGPKELHLAESPEHYFDVELLAGAAPPDDRYAFLKHCAAKGLDPRKVGLLPYALTEWTQRLTVALAEHRAYPDNPHIRTKCLVYAGILAHYAADACQPLHLTIHWDGRADPNGESPRTGIHKNVDALLGKLTFDRSAVLKDVKPAAFEKLLPSVLDRIGKGRKLVETVYKLEKDLPPMDAPLKAESPAGRFAADRLRAAVAFAASLYLTAWMDSKNIVLPTWYKRPYDPPPKASAAP